MNQSSCCCGDFEFMDAAYCYYDPNRRCVKNDCGACPYTVSVLSQDVEDCFCHSSCPPSCSSTNGNYCNCCCSLPNLSQSDSQEDSDCSCQGVACKQDSCAMSRRICCDRDGTCCLYPEHCRDGFWPEFSHPRWLCCKDLYSGENHYDSCCQGNGSCGCEENDD